MLKKNSFHCLSFPCLAKTAHILFNNIINTYINKTRIYTYLS